jgi:3-deoxy-D-manno-octulosonic-acid transferase
LYSLGVRIAALFGNAKAIQWVEGRKTQRTAFRQAQRPAQRPASAEVPEPVEGPTEQWIWFHAASLGEFEQGRPVIEALKKEFPQYKILLSFFSPSGYEIRKDYPLADEVFYLPSDTPSHAAQWVQRHHFVAAFFIKYEFWFNYMRALKDAGIHLFYISLILKPDSYFFRWYGTWFFRQLKNVTHFFVQDDTTAQLLQTHGLTNVTVCGDTRFDRVAAIAQQAKPFPEVEQFIGGRQCIIAGSTWPPDEKLLVDFYQELPDDYCLIIAPHDISESHVSQIKTLFPDHQLYTGLDAQKHSKVLVINTIGILSQLYQYARFVYIGGGFGVNIHNIQEPVTFGCPVVFGPKYKSFKEAVDLVGLEGAFSVEDKEALASVFGRLMHDETFYMKASETCRNYLNSQVGATESILKGFKKALFS